MSDKVDVEQWIKQLNAAWVAEEYAQLQPLLHPRVSMATPNGETIMGEELLIESYRQFMTNATLHRFDLTAIEVDAFTTTAVVRASFWIDYEMAGERHEESGVDLWVLEKATESGCWLGVWRTQLPSPELEAPQLTEFRCPACQRTILNRRLANCEFCGEVLPEKLRLSEAEKAQRREWELKRLRRLQREENQTRFGPKLTDPGLLGDELE